MGPFRQCEGHISPTLAIHFSTRGNHDVLTPSHLVAHRRASPNEWKFRFPQYFPRVLIESAELVVKKGCSHEHQASGSHDRTAIVLGASVLQSFGGKFRVFSQRHFPKISAGI